MDTVTSASTTRLQLVTSVSLNAVDLHQVLFVKYAFVCCPRPTHVTVMWFVHQLINLHISRITWCCGCSGDFYDSEYSSMSWKHPCHAVVHQNAPACTLMPIRVEFLGPEFTARSGHATDGWSCEISLNRNSVNLQEEKNGTDPRQSCSNSAWFSVGVLLPRDLEGQRSRQKLGERFNVLRC